jgi:signal transduction histidine kinase
MIRTRLTALNCTVLAVVLAVLGVGLYLYVRQSLYNQVDAGLLARADNFKKGWMHDNGPPGPSHNHHFEPPDFGGDGGPPENQGIDPRQVREIDAASEVLMPMVLKANGEDIVFADRKTWDEPGLRAALRGKETFGFGEREDIPLRVLSTPLPDVGKTGKVLQLASPISGIQQGLAQFAQTLWIALPLAILIMMAAGMFLTRRALRPIRGITQAAETIEATNLAERLPVTGNDEFAQLSTTFNTMLARLEREFHEKDEVLARQKQFVADASHELRTPLTAIQARVDIGLKGDLSEKTRDHLEAIGRASGIMAGLVRDLLILARSDEGNLRLSRQTVNLDALIHQAMNAVDPRGHAIQVDGSPEIEVEVEPDSMTRVLINILENSVRYSDPGTPVLIRATSSGDEVKIAVEDSGPGIPAQDVLLVFNRFYRVDASRDRSSGGTGLGLAIAKAIVEGRGGRISLVSEERRGTTVTIMLPTKSGHPSEELP